MYLCKGASSLAFFLTTGESLDGSITIHSIQSQTQELRTVRNGTHMKESQMKRDGVQTFAKVSS